MRFCQKFHKISKILCIKMCKFVVVLFYFISIRGSRMAQFLFRFSFAPKVFFSGTMVLTPHVTDEFHFDSLRNCSCFYYLLVLWV